MDFQSVFITGVSSGIGHGLAQAWLNAGTQVRGVSRRIPSDLLEYGTFSFQQLDLNDAARIEPVVRELVADDGHLDLVVLNAGRLGKFSDLHDADAADLQQTMTVNVWSNKFVLDALVDVGVKLRQVVAISSGAAVNGNRGWSGYSISKAALNMLVRLYARELPDIHFAALAPGLVATEIQEQLRAIPADPRFPGLQKMRGLHGTPAMPPPQAAAARLIPVFRQLPDLVESGSYVDIRELPG